jgi:hypothetical protein
MWMSGSPTPLIDPINQKYIEIDLVYYDNAERDAFKANYLPEVVARIDALMKSRLKVTTADFLQFYMLNMMSSGLPRFASVDQIRAMLVHATQWIGPFLVFGNGSIQVPGGATIPAHVIEKVGEAIGLCVASEIHQVNHADWAKIPVRKLPRNRTLLPSFDFAQASDGQHLLQLEIKGTQSKDSRNIEPSVSNHRAAIREKKAKLAGPPDGQVDPFPAHVRYGTVTAIDNRADGRVRCRLVDPDPLDPEISPRDFKLLARVAFLARWINIVSPQSQLASALANRYVALRALANPYDLDGVPLVRADGETISYARLGRDDEEHSSFFASKSRVIGEAVGGVAFQSKYGKEDARIAFVGIREELVNLAIAQEFDALTEFSYLDDSGTSYRTVEFVFSPTRFSELRLPPSFSQLISPAGNYKSFRLEGPLHFSSSGLVFGWFQL